MDGAAMESGLDDELSDADDADIRQRIIYKIGKFSDHGTLLKILCYN